MGTGRVSAAWIGMRMVGVANGEYKYVCLCLIGVEEKKFKGHYNSKDIK